jgi:hypothetical protein
MKNIFLPIITSLFFFTGICQNSILTVLKKGEVLTSADYNLVLIVNKNFVKINESDSLHYSKFAFVNSEVTSLLLIRQNDTLEFFGLDGNKFLIEYDSNGYKSLGLSISQDAAETFDFDFELCKDKKLNITVNLSDASFKEIYSEMVLGIENPDGKYSSEITSKYQIRQAKKKI